MPEKVTPVLVVVLTSHPFDDNVLELRWRVGADSGSCPLVQVQHSELSLEHRNHFHTCTVPIKSEEKFQYLVYHKGRNVSQNSASSLKPGVFHTVHCAGADLPLVLVVADGFEGTFLPHKQSRPDKAVLDQLLPLVTYLSQPNETSPQCIASRMVAVAQQTQVYKPQNEGGLTIHLKTLQTLLKIRPEHALAVGIASRWLAAQRKLCTSQFIGKLASMKTALPELKLWNELVATCTTDSCDAFIGLLEEETISVEDFFVCDGRQGALGSKSDGC